MRPVSRWLVRPLLPFRRRALLEYVRARSLPVWIDPANSDPAHLRSWIRVEALPFLRRRVPAIDEHLLRTAAQAARDRRAWDALLDTLTDLDLRADADGFSVAGVPLAGYDSALAESLIMALARRAGCTLGPARISSVLALLARGESGTEVPLGAGWRAELDFGRLRISPARGSGRGPAVGRWRGRAGREPGGGGVCAGGLIRPPSARSAPPSSHGSPRGSLEVRGWSPGDRVRPLAGTGRRLVARCFQDAKVSRTRRESWPVVAGEGVVVWVPGVCRSDALLPTEGAGAVRVDAEYA